ncbi:SDR family NAD(P)-dependent oxidoreductase [Cohnella herbarum]|uniref:SDR family NAD(P)-dependent oxidoreductase n=1 Tax=Cohnella herbarum TaxID=2728023 RepID=A0A7Z2VRC0_9BACL|nr:SDR family NAD(P)-dependent oxidoreductase [Cohnella herbarum]QJD87719.1 SDR family NAD(P)-dependent oxidoreductase [Cohnella herbarum]
MKVVIIGASRGLGLELTRKFLEEGHTVAAGFRNHPSHALEELSVQYSDKAMLFSSDVKNEEEIRKGAERCAGFLQEADALCNAAGVLLPGDRVNLLHQSSVDELRETFEVNTIGAVIVAKNFYPVIKKGGKLLTVTSEGPAIKNCGTWVPCYALSKTAATKVSGIFNRSIEDVDFYSVHPGRMNTDMGRTTAQIEPQEAAEGFYRLMTGETPMSRDEWYINYKGEPMDA